ncbi:MAG: DNA polymerase I [Bacteroidota bacterium]
MAAPKKLFLIDAMGLIYRAHFALHQYTRTNSKGVAVGALLGFANALVEVLEKQTPTHVIAAFDMKAPTWRKKLYPAYKAQRQEQPEAITAAIPYSKELLGAFHIPSIGFEGYEADDIIGTLSQKATQKGYEVYIMSADKDLAQLVNPHVHLYKPSSGGKPAVIWDEKEVLAHWGVAEVTQIPDILGLWGDASDNIPGVPKVGAKTAKKLIAQFGSVERLIEKATTLKGALQKQITTYKDQALLSKQLATIDQAVPIDIDLHTSKYTGPDAALLGPLLADLEFNRLAKRLLGPFKAPSAPSLPLFADQILTQAAATTDASAAAPDGKPALKKYGDIPVAYTCIDEEADIRKLVKKVGTQPSFCFDTETTGLDPHTATLLGIAIADTAHKAFFIPIPTDQEAAAARLALLQPLFKSKKRKVGQNLKYDLLVLHQAGLQVEGPFFDTMIAHHLLAPNTRYSLTALAKAYLQYSPIEIDTLIGPKGKGQLNMAQVPLNQLVPYACEDADITLQIYEKMLPLLVQEQVDKLFYTLEMGLLPVLAKMEATGVAIDQEMLAAISQTLGNDLTTIEQKIYTLAGTTFNIGSPKQLGEVLFDKLTIVEKPTKTAKGQYATGDAILAKLVRKHPIVTEVRSFRALKKLKNTYVDALPALVGEDGRIHTSYQQGLVSTGRLSSANPNLQNIPIRTARGREIRGAFVAGAPSYFLISADYSQIELRIIAHFARDEAMIEAFKTGVDIHKMTACHIFNVSPAEVTSAMRRKAKMVNFGIIYGISAFGLAQRLDITRREAAFIIETYFEKFPTIKQYMDDVIATTKEKGYVTTLMGRKRFLPDINSKNMAMRGFAERNAINMPIQGTAAELIQYAMIEIDHWITKKKIPAKMVLQVHDELIFEVAPTAVDVMKEKIPQLMAGAIPLDVPIEVSLGVGKNWLQAH